MHFETLGPADAPPVILSAGLGGSASFWKPQLAALSAHHRVILYDHRGTGANAGVLPENYRISDMADDVLAILDALKLPSAAFVGHALGGLVGMELALRQPERVSHLVLVNAWAKLDSQTRRCFTARLELLKHAGIPAYVQAQPIFLFPAWWLSAHAEEVERDVAHATTHFQGVDNLLRRIGALQQFDVADELPLIQTPTLVCAARDDILVPWTASRILADSIPGAAMQLLPEGGHAYSATVPGAFNAALLAFLASGEPV